MKKTRNKRNVNGTAESASQETEKRVNNYAGKHMK